MTSGTIKARAGRLLATTTLSVVAAGMVLAPCAYAATSSDLQSQLDAAREQLEASYSEAELAEYDLISVSNSLDATNEQITQLEGDITQKEAELDQVQAQLADIISSEYKGGTANLVSIILGSDSIESFVSHLTYANKVSESQQQVISQAKDLKASLESQRSSLEEQRSTQEQLVSEQQAKKDTADQAAAAAQATYDQLDDQVKEQLAAEQAAAAEAAQKAAEEEAAKVAAAQEAEAAASTGSDSSEASSNGSSNSSNSSSNSNSSSGSSDSSNSSSSSNVPSSGMIARAQAIIGSGYQWSGYTWTGSTSSSSFTCSGVVDFALGYGPCSHSPEDYYSMVGNITTDVSQLSVGDLVFFTYAGRYPGHVGIYVGNGTMIDSSPDGGVQYRSVYKSSFIGGGSL